MGLDLTAMSPPSPSSPGLLAGPEAVEAPASGRRTMMEADMARIQSTSTKLSDTQLVILSAAAQRADHSLLPFPQSLTAKGAALDKVIATLRKRKLIEERRIVDGADEWRRDADNRAYGLSLTTAGLLALGVEETDKDKPAVAAAAMPSKRKTAAAHPRRKGKKASSVTSKRRSALPQSKQGLVIQMLRRQSGVTIDDIVAKTGWQPHSVRGFFSGLVRKKLNLPLVSDVGKDGVRHYHIASVASSKA